MSEHLPSPSGVPIGSRAEDPATAAEQPVSHSEWPSSPAAPLVPPAEYPPAERPAAEHPAADAESLTPWHPARVRGLSGILAPFNETGELAAADIHVAKHLAEVTGEDAQTVLLAVALTVRATRHGSVCLDTDILPTGPDDVRCQQWPQLLPEHWPQVDDWARELADSPLVVAPPGAASAMHLDGPRLYLDRYWQEETQVLTHLQTRAAIGAEVDEARLATSLATYFPGESYVDQLAAADVACRALTSVITGGPGTGKTTTISRFLGVLLDQDPNARIALAAPTGKAAARMAGAVRDATTQETFPSEHAERIGALAATTIHRLLGSIPDRSTRFRHHRGNPLPMDVIIIDETSMVSLTMMARVLEALRPSARLVLVGDADQLASVEAGAVLGDLVTGLQTHPSAPVAQLTRNRRFGQAIGVLATAVRDGDVDTAMANLADGTTPCDTAKLSDGVELAGAHGAAGERGMAGACETTGEYEIVGESGTPRLIDAADLAELVLPAAERIYDHAVAGDRAGALAALDEHRLLCAHRDGPAGVGFWNRQIEDWLRAAVITRLGDAGDVGATGRMLPGRSRWYPGQPLLITANDYGLHLFNGDMGVVVTTGDGTLAAAIADGINPEGRLISLARLTEVGTAHAMTVHRSQGSQFRDVSMLLPDADSQILTRELLYTALTRARRSVSLVGSRDVLVRGIAQHTGRASGLAQRLERSQLM